MAYVSKEGGRDERNVEYEFNGPSGSMGGRETCTSSPTERVIGGIISAWNMRVVGWSARVVMARATSDEDMAGNSSTYPIKSASARARIKLLEVKEPWSRNSAALISGM